MSHSLPPHQPLARSPDELRTAVLRYATNSLYLDNEEWENSDNPYRRQLRPQALGPVDFSQPLTRDRVKDYDNLAAHRLLTCIYVADLMFLPKSGLASRWDDFQRFYSRSNRALGE